MHIEILFNNLCKFEFYFLKYETRKRHDQQINSKKSWCSFRRRPWFWIESILFQNIYYFLNVFRVLWAFAQFIRIAISMLSRNVESRQKNKIVYKYICNQKMIYCWNPEDLCIWMMQPCLCFSKNYYCTL